MVQKSILEQLNILVNIFMSNKNALKIAIASGIIFIIFSILNHFRNKKITKVILLLIYALIFGVLIYFYHSHILTLLDYMVDNIFILLFFPNLAVYTLVIVVANILLIKAIFGNYKYFFKFISILFFICFNIIFYLIIDNIVKNNIFIYEPLTIYTNSNLLVLIQLSMYLFVGYLLVNLIFNISKYIMKPVKITEKVIVREPVIETKVNKTISDIPEITPNTLVVANDDIKNIRSANIYNEYIDIEPIKKKKVEFTSLTDMDILFGNSVLSNIMNDINSLKEDVNNQNKIRKIYESISLNSKDLSLKDYNYLIKALREIKNNN